MFLRSPPRVERGRGWGWGFLLAGASGMVCYGVWMVRCLSACIADVVFGEGGLELNCELWILSIVHCDPAGV